MDGGLDEARVMHYHRGALTDSVRQSRLIIPASPAYHWLSCYKQETVMARVVTEEKGYDFSSQYREVL